MNSVFIIVEGYTEQAIFDNCFAPFLGQENIGLKSVLVSKPRHRGGNDFGQARTKIRGLLHNPNYIVTMCFDYCGLPRDWPGLDRAQQAREDEIPSIMEHEISIAVLQGLPAEYGFRFIPYIHMHEIECLLFTDPATMANELGKPKLARKVERIVKDCGGCERINSRPDRSPARRIRELFPGYRKGSLDPTSASGIISQIGPEKILDHCPNFRRWLDRIAERARAA